MFYVWRVRSAHRDDLASVARKPATGGKLIIQVNERVIYERKRDGGFPDAPIIKQRVRVLCLPGRSPGHGDLPCTPLS
ncbi:Rdx family protein [Mangrovibacter phragmitis]|uniref:Rdx family protein n=1 Tax=Mangrovibacter phragmitis TaxID=1691903 RepID=UPI0009EF16DB|nr:Rdx family protein [Mangrovibacter phragmitis]